MATRLSRGSTFGVHAKHATFTFADTTADTVAVLPPESYIVDIIVDVQTAFAGGVMTCNIGTPVTANLFANAVALNATGRVAVTLLEGGESPNVVSAAPQEVQVTVGAGNAAGSATIMVLYICLQHSHLH